MRAAVFAFMLGFAPVAFAATYQTVIPAAQVAAYIEGVEKEGYVVRFVVPAMTTSHEVCQPCMTFADGHIACASGAEAPFCHTETEVTQVLVVHQDRSQGAERRAQ